MGVSSSRTVVMAERCLSRLSPLSASSAAGHRQQGGRVRSASLWRLALCLLLLRQCRADDQRRAGRSCFVCRLLLVASFLLLYMT